MTEENTTETPGFVRYQRNGLSFSLPVPVGDTFDVMEENGRNAGRVVTCAVLDVLGVEYEIDPDTLAVRLLAVDGTPEPAAAAALPARPAHVDEALWADLVANQDDWFDNRADKARGVNAQGQPVKATSPDFKRRGDGVGIWLTAPRRGGQRRAA